MFILLFFFLVFWHLSFLVNSVTGMSQGEENRVRLRKVYFVILWFILHVPFKVMHQKGRWRGVHLTQVHRNSSSSQQTFSHCSVSDPPSPVLIRLWVPPDAFHTQNPSADFGCIAEASLCDGCGEMLSSNRCCHSGMLCLAK